MAVRLVSGVSHGSAVSGIAKPEVAWRVDSAVERLREMVCEAQEREDLPDVVLGECIGLMARLESLWRSCEKNPQAQSCDDVCTDMHVSSTRAVEILVGCLRKRIGVGSQNSEARWGQVLACAMCLIRWTARWGWLRHKPLSDWLCAAAGHVYELAEEYGVAKKQYAGAFPTLMPLAVERDYIALLFVQWLSPASLSSVTQFALEQLLVSACRGLHIELLSEPRAEEVVDLGTGQLYLGERALGAADTSRFRRLPLRVAAERISERLATEQPPLMSSAVLGQLRQTAIFRSKRYMIRLGHRTPVADVAQLCIGYERILRSHTVVREDGTPVNPGYECAVQDKSPEGCRLFIPLAAASGLCIGALVYVTGVHGSEGALGVVRWLRRTITDDWEAGIWLLRGKIALKHASTEVGVWPSGLATEPVMIVGGGPTPGELVMAALPRGTGTAVRRIEAGGVFFEWQFGLESGPDYDLAAFMAIDVLASREGSDTDQQRADSAIRQ